MLRIKLAIIIPIAMDNSARRKIGILIKYGNGNRLIDTTSRLTTQKIIKIIAITAMRESFMNFTTNSSQGLY